MTKKWSKKYNKCIICETAEKKHFAKGMCKKCYNKKWKKENPIKVEKHKIKFEKRNPEYMKEYNKKQQKENIESYRKSQKEYRRKRRINDARFRLRENISSQIRSRLKRRILSKSKKSTFSFLPYTIDQLIQHLEKQFKPWMNWQNYGNGYNKWNIDHKKPDSLFNYKSIKDEEFQKCWALSNLKPMDSIENIKKGNKYYI